MVRQRLPVLLSRPGDDSDQDLQRRLDQTQHRVNESLVLGVSGAAHDIRNEQVQQWTVLCQDALDARPELAFDLTGLVDEITVHFDQPGEQSVFPGPPPGAPRPGFGSPAPAGAPPSEPPAPGDDAGSWGYREGTPPGASFGDDDDFEK
jgi:hypothetical protein